MARAADDLRGKKDHKLAKAVELIEALVGDGFNPIVFCRFIPTAEYVAAALRPVLGGRAEVACVTGTLAPAEREARVLELAQAPRRVLVATDCLSEGINLQEHFDAVLHYDLAWSPTRHERREGRADRFGQASELVRVVTYYGTDNQIDGIVLDVLLRKHRQIRKSLGVAIPVPSASNEVMEAIFEGLLLRRGDNFQLGLFDHISGPKTEQLHLEWEDAAETERRSQRTMFAQQSIKVEEVTKELAAAHDAIGSADDVEEFVAAAVPALGGAVQPRPDGSYEVNLTGASAAVSDAVADQDRLRGRFKLPLRHGGEVYLSRTHPFVEGLASHILTSALDNLTESPAARCGAVRTDSVARRTTLLLVRYRFDIVTIRGELEQVLLAEDTAVSAFAGPADAPDWLDAAAIGPLLDAVPSGNIATEQASRFLQAVREASVDITKHLSADAHKRAEQLLATHRRVRSESGRRGVRYRVGAHTPPDILGVYVLLPPAPRALP